MYERWTNPTNLLPWFSLLDCFYRLMLTVIGHYWNMVSQPFNFLYYTFKYGWVWYGLHSGIIMAICYPVLPFYWAVHVTITNFKGLFVSNWMTDGPGGVFFVKPNNYIAAFLWDWYITNSMFVG